MFQSFRRILQQTLVLVREEVPNQDERSTENEEDIRFVSKKERIRIVLTFLLIGLIAVFDGFLPGAAFNGVPYIAAVLLTLIVRPVWLTYTAWGLSVFLTVIVPILSLQGDTDWNQRFLGVCAISVTSFVTLLRKRIETRIDLLVEERTKDYLTAKEALEQELKNRKDAEAANYRLESHLLQARKNETIGVVAKGIAHNFNNLLQPIIALSDMAQMDVESGSQLKTDLQLILQSATRARDLVNQISGHGIEGEQPKVEVNLGEAVKRAVNIVRSSFRGEVEPILQEEDGLPLTKLQPKHLDQIVSILFDNARRAMVKPGGKLWIRVGETELPDNHQIQPAGLRGGRYLRLEFEDEGEGMPPEILERVFEPFFTTRDVSDGTGLGLTVVRGLVFNYKGGYKMTSIPGKGTSIELYFRPTEFEGDTGIIKDEPIANAKGKRIMVVDDDVECITGIERMLEGMEISVHTENSAQDALAIIRDKPEKFDLILTDESMPEMTGLQLATEARVIRPEMPVVILSGLRDTSYLGGFVKGGGGSVLYKPIQPRELEKAIRRAFSKKARHD